MEERAREREFVSEGEEEEERGDVEKSTERGTSFSFSPPRAWKGEFGLGTLLIVYQVTEDLSTNTNG